MSELGNILKTAREEKGYTLEDIQEITKIQKRYIEAIENGNYHLLPGPFYTRAFVKNIAETLGLNAEEVLSSYEEVVPLRSKEGLETIPRRKQKVGPTFSIGQWVSRVLLVVFVVLILFIIYWFLVKNLPPAENVQENPSPSIDLQGNLPAAQNPSENQAPEQQPEPEPEPEPEPPKPLLTFVKEEDKVGYYTMENVDQLEITMTATRGPCWFDIRPGKNGKLIEMATFAKGQEKSWTFTEEKEIYINLGATRNMDIIVNGQSIDLTQKPDGYDVQINLIPAE